MSEIYNKVPPEISEEMRLILIFLILSTRKKQITLPSITRLQEAYKDVRLVKKCHRDKDGNVVNSVMYTEKIDEKELTWQKP